MFKSREIKIWDEAISIYPPWTSWRGSPFHLSSMRKTRHIGLTHTGIKNPHILCWEIVLKLGILTLRKWSSPELLQITQWIFISSVSLIYSHHSTRFTFLHSTTFTFLALPMYIFTVLLWWTCFYAMNNSFGLKQPSIRTSKNTLQWPSKDLFLSIFSLHFLRHQLSEHWKYFPERQDEFYC